MSVEKISVDQSKIVADKVNDVMRKSFEDKSYIVMEDIVNAGLSCRQAKKLMKGFVSENIVYLTDGRYHAHPEMKGEKNE